MYRYCAEKIIVFFLDVQDSREFSTYPPVTFFSSIDTFEFVLLQNTYAQKCSKNVCKMSVKCMAYILRTKIKPWHFPNIFPTFLFRFFLICYTYILYVKNINFFYFKIAGTLRFWFPNYLNPHSMGLVP